MRIITVDAHNASVGSPAGVSGPVHCTGPTVMYCTAVQSTHGAGWGPLERTVQSPPGYS